MSETSTLERDAPVKTDYELVTETSRLEEIVPILEESKTLSLDTEATHFDPYQAKLLLVQIATKEAVFVIDVSKAELTPIKHILEAPRPLKIVQNAKFDYQMLKVRAGITLSGIYDTMLAERLLTNGLSREISLKTIAKKYLGMTLDKTVRESFADPKSMSAYGKFTKQQLDYAARDAQILYEIFQLQLKKLQQEDLMEVAKLEFALVPVVSEMEIRGSLIDTVKWREHIRSLREQRDEINQSIQADLKPLSRHIQVDLFGGEDDVINLDSPSQLLQAFKQLGVDLPSTGEAILAQTDHPLAKKILEYRGFEKMITAFGESLLEKINPITGRLHPDFLQLGADTGRFACNNPNLQQIPQDSAFRSCFVATPGYKMITADYSQIELRIMAEYSQDPTFLKAFAEDIDLHSLTASQMYRKPLAEVDKKMRHAAKTINFGLMYGRGPVSLAAQINVSVDESKELLNIYFNTYRGVKAWLDKTGRDALKFGFSTTLGGRKRWYETPAADHPDYQKLAGSIERQGKNTPIQGTSADITKYALIYVAERIKKEGWDAYLIHTVHDEIVAEAKTDIAEAVAKAIDEEMVRAAEKLLKNVSVKVDVHVSDCWEK